MLIPNKPNVPFEPASDRARGRSSFAAENGAESYDVIRLAPRRSRRAVGGGDGRVDHLNGGGSERRNEDAVERSRCPDDQPGDGRLLGWLDMAADGPEQPEQRPAGDNVV